MRLNRWRDVFQTPESYKPPPDSDIMHDVEYPNRNSIDFSKRPINRTLCMHKSWDIICSNDDGHIAMATNRREGRDWSGVFFGFDQLNELSVEKSIFHLQCSHIIEQMQYATSTLLVVAMADGSLRIWSTHTKKHESTLPFCLFLMTEATEHKAPIICMDVMKANTPHMIITACMNDSIKIWNIENLNRNNLTYLNAHANTITGVTTHTEHSRLFATCSLDKLVILWDTRQSKPANRLFMHRKGDFTDISWLSTAQCGHNNHIYVSDSVGFLHTLDKRRPDIFFKSVKCFENNSLPKMYIKDNKLAMTDRQRIKILSITEEEKCYETANISNNCNNDATWLNPKTFLTVDTQCKLNVHRVE